ncbi:MAG: hypothetical protein IKF90_25060 [Parasporobacterium sp.]|nr:hypothetical protein [Parasporobacterium sp.]
MGKVIEFTEKNMANLLEVYDALYDLIDALNLIGEVTQDDGILGRLLAIEELIQNLSPVYIPDENVCDEESVFWHTLTDRDGDVEERARILMES